MKTLTPIKELTLRLLKYKTVALLGISSAQRGAIRFNSWTFGTRFWTFSIGDKLKQTKPGTHVPELKFPGYPSDASLCVVVVIIKEYLERTKHLRNGITSLFVTYVKPYKVGSKSIISRWIKSTLGLTGIDISRFKPHSIGASSTSAAALAKVVLDTIF